MYRIPRKPHIVEKRKVIESSLFTNDILLSIVPFLDCRDLVNLTLTCRRLGSAAMDNNDHSLVEEVAKQTIEKLQTDEERAAMKRYNGESWIALLNELQLLRSPLTFDNLVGDRIEYVNGDKSCCTSSNTDESSMNVLDNIWTGTPQSAICSEHIMRSGRHFATFTFTGAHRFCYFFAGVMRPSPWLHASTLSSFAPWLDERRGILHNQKNEQWGDSKVNFCLYDHFDVRTCFCGDWKAPGKTSAPWDEIEYDYLDDVNMIDGVIGLLLDLDQGTLTVYKNGRKLGVMMRGLSGEYCWTATILAQMHGEPHEQNIRIERGSVPTS